jgi:hypothetical protein
MKKSAFSATLAAALWAAPASSHPGSSGHHGSEGLLPHIHGLTGEALLILLGLAGVVFGVQRLIVAWKSRHDSR